MRGRWIWIVGSLAVGFAIIAVSWGIDGQALIEPALRTPFIRWSWVSGALVNLGSALVLFAPFFWLTERLSSRVNYLGREVATTQEEVGTAQARLQAVADAQNPEMRRETAAEMDNAVRERLSEPRVADEAMYASVATAPSPELIVRALRKAQQDELISTAWPRCELFMSDFHVRFTIVGPETELRLVLAIETATGEVLHLLTWRNDQPAVEIFASIADRLKQGGGYPGDELFFPGQLPIQLSDLLLYASRFRPSVTGSIDIHRVIEILDDGWILMDDGMAPKSYRSYKIETSRYDEIDWESHIRHKGWPESYAFGSALEIAKGLRARYPPA